MPSTNVSAIKGTVMRTMKLDVCGNPVTGASGALIVEPGFISVKKSPQYEDGTEFLQKLASGILCINQKDGGQLKRNQLDILLCVLNPDLVVQLTAATEILSGATGTGAFYTDAVLNGHTSLELWQQVSGRNACVNGVQQYVYWGFMNTTNWQVGDDTIENAAYNYDIKGETAAASTTWGSFPTTLPPSAYFGTNFPPPGAHWGHNVTTIAPPSPTFGAIALT